MEGGPFGPWLTATPAPAGGPVIDAPEDVQAPLVEQSGTTWDEFVPIYASMAIPGPLRRGYSTAEVDAMEVPVVGMLLRVGAAPKTAEDEAADMLRRRMEAERLGLPPPDW